MFQPFIEFFYRHRCPKCETVNWTYHSHSQRHEPIHSPEICKCHSCNERYWLMSKDVVEDIYPEDDYELEDGETLMDVCGATQETGIKGP